MDKKIVRYFAEYYETFGADGLTGSGKPYIAVVNDDVVEFGDVLQGIPFVQLDISSSGKVRDVRRVYQVSPVD